jgi:hypothetical protein
MPGLEEVRHYMRGLVLLMRHDPQGLRHFDFTDRGMMRSFWAVFWCLPPILISWAWRRALFVEGMPDGFEPGTLFYGRLAMVEVANWLTPVVLAGLMLLGLGAIRLFPAVVVVTNWLSVPFSYAFTVLVLMLATAPALGTIVSLIWLVMVLALVVVLFRILAFLTKGQALMTGTLTMLLLVPPLLVTDWLQQYLGVY